MDDGVHARYILVRSDEPNYSALLTRINKEFIELMKRKLYAGQYKEMPQEFAEELALKAMVLMVLSHRKLSPENQEYPAGFLINGPV